MKFKNITIIIMILFLFISLGVMVEGEAKKGSSKEASAPVKDSEKDSPGKNVKPADFKDFPMNWNKKDFVELRMRYKDKMTNYGKNEVLISIESGESVNLDWFALIDVNSESLKSENPDDKVVKMKKVWSESKLKDKWASLIQKRVELTGVGAGKTKFVLEKVDNVKKKTFKVKATIQVLP
jgi:hypothetical protein